MKGFVVVWGLVAFVGTCFGAPKTTAPTAPTQEPATVVPTTRAHTTTPPPTAPTQQPATVVPTTHAHTTTPPPKVPVFGGRYHARGHVKLPYAELDEPFEIYFDGPKAMGRIDYYNGLDKVFYRGDQKPHGFTYKISPSVKGKGTDVQPVSCFQINGTKSATVMPQNMLPNLKNFTYAGQEMINGESTDVWKKTVFEGVKRAKVNRYSFYVSTMMPVVPVRYEMFGYDSLLGSHFDKYVIDFDFFDNMTAIDPSTFSTPKGIKCGSFPGPGIEQHIVANPYRELINPELGDRYHEMFTEHKAIHGKQYTDALEHAKRRTQFTHNVRFIHGVNRQGLSYKLGVNHLADWSEDELRVMRGRRTSTGYNGGAPFPYDEFKSAPTPPDFVDWRLMGAVSQVKDQAICGSCWSFGATGTIEGAYFLKNKKMVRFSQQNLMDCSWGFGDNACDGGEEWRAFSWIKQNHGLMTEDDYGSYMGQNGMCHYDPKKAAVQLKSYVNVTSGDMKALKTAVASVGPITVGIDAHLKTFGFYASGIYYDKNCGNKPADLDHAVLVVGYGSQKMGNQTTNYWIVKNSWSTYWGNNGYILMNQQGNNCGVATDASYVVLK
ncbi:cathepsin L2-like [Acanthaster planci]|uniref:Cathepsin L2-like n=1 Tax=Acanthaster planci TaxID=133434 RepID=A0A8B7ZC54_ACAPL|nr:cathepsin L2-like [Acanthaster planci]